MKLKKIWILLFIAIFSCSYYVPTVEAQAKRPPASKGKRPTTKKTTKKTVRKKTTKKTPSKTSPWAAKKKQDVLKEEYLVAKSYAVDLDTQIKRIYEFDDVAYNIKRMKGKTLFDKTNTTKMKKTLAGLKQFVNSPVENASTSSRVDELIFKPKFQPNNKLAQNLLRDLAAQDLNIRKNRKALNELHPDLYFFHLEAIEAYKDLIMIVQSLKW